MIHILVKYGRDLILFADSNLQWRTQCRICLAIEDKFYWHQIILSHASPSHVTVVNPLTRTEFIHFTNLVHIQCIAGAHYNFDI